MESKSFLGHIISAIKLAHYEGLADANKAALDKTEQQLKQFYGISDSNAVTSAAMERGSALQKRANDLNEKSSNLKEKIDAIKNDWRTASPEETKAAERLKELDKQKLDLIKSMAQTRANPENYVKEVRKIESEQAGLKSTMRGRNSIDGIYAQRRGLRDTVIALALLASMLGGVTGGIYGAAKAKEYKYLNDFLKTPTVQTLQAAEDRMGHNSYAYKHKLLDGLMKFVSENPDFDMCRIGTEAMFDSKDYKMIKPWLVMLAQKGKLNAVGDLSPLAKEQQVDVLYTILTNGSPTSLVSLLKSNPQLVDMIDSAGDSTLSSRFHALTMSEDILPALYWGNVSIGRTQSASNVYNEFKASVADGTLSIEPTEDLLRMCIREHDIDTIRKMRDIPTTNTEVKKNIPLAIRLMKIRDTLDSETYLAELRACWGTPGEENKKNIDESAIEYRHNKKVTAAYALAKENAAALGMGLTSYFDQLSDYATLLLNVDRTLSSSLDEVLAINGNWLSFIAGNSRWAALGLGMMVGNYTSEKDSIEAPLMALSKAGKREKIAYLVWQMECYLPNMDEKVDPTKFSPAFRQMINDQIAFWDEKKPEYAENFRNFKKDYLTK